MIEGKTGSGYAFAIDENLMNDFEIVDAIADITDGEPSRLITGLSTFVDKILGKEGKKALYDHVRTPDGRVPIESIEKEIGEIMTAAGEASKK